MTQSSRLADLALVGHLGPPPDRLDAPLRLLPVYQNQDGSFAAPPFSEEGESIGYEPLSPEAFEALAATGEVTPLSASQPAQAAHTLWFEEDGLHYEPTDAANARLSELAGIYIDRAVAVGIASDVAEYLLFGSLRATFSVTAAALLVVHYNIVGQYNLALVLRSDIAGVRTREALERELVKHVAAISADNKYGSAFAMEVRRSVHRQLADELRSQLPPWIQDASDIPPRMSWALSEPEFAT